MTTPPFDFDSHPTLRKADMTQPTPQPPKRLTRSRDDRIVAGVCGGLARYLNVDASMVRIVAVALTVLLGGAPLMLYVVAVLVVPEDDRVGPTPPPAPGQPPWPTSAPGPRPADPVWGSEGAPWEQPTAGNDAPSSPRDDDGTSDPQRPDAR